MKIGVESGELEDVWGGCSCGVVPRGDLVGDVGMGI